MQGSKSPEVDDNLEVGLKLSSCPPQNSVHQHDIVGESEHILDHSTSGSAVQANASAEVVREVLAESRPENHLTNKSSSTCIQKTATLSNGPGCSTRQPAHWGRTPVSITGYLHICCIFSTLGPLLPVTRLFF